MSGADAHDASDIEPGLTLTRSPRDRVCQPPRLQSRPAAHWGPRTAASLSPQLPLGTPCCLLLRVRTELVPNAIRFDEARAERWRASCEWIDSTPIPTHIALQSQLASLLQLAQCISSSAAAMLGHSQAGRSAQPSATQCNKPMQILAVRTHITCTCTSPLSSHSQAARAARQRYGENRASQPRGKLA